MQLGIVLAPYGHIPGAFPSAINYSTGGNGTFLCPDDPQFNQRGESGYFFDTQLGAVVKPNWFTRQRYKRAMKKLGLGQIPTDAELATVRGYTPVESGWVATANPKAALPGPWIPPNGAPQGGYPMPASLYGLRDTAPTVIPAVAPPAIQPPASVEDVMDALNAHNDRVFSLALVSTTAVAISAVITIFRTIKLIREDARD